MDSITERIAQRASAQLKNEIREFMKPVFNRILNPPDYLQRVHASPYRTTNGMMVDIVTLLNFIKETMYEQEIASRTEVEIKKFMAQVENKSE